MSRLRRKTLRISSRRLALRPRVNLMTSVRKPAWTIVNRLARMLRLNEAKQETRDEAKKR
jgi:hypothetical protein